MEHIRGLDGLRGFLVICIVIFHTFTVFFPMNLSYFSGGFLAVESFFVISGFLIVKTLINIFSNSDSRYNALQTYIKRRFLRIFPALLFTVLLTSILIVVFNLDFKEKTKEEPIFGLSFIYNFYLIFRDVPYFQKFQDTNFLLHLWSLSIEVQLYLIAGLIFLFFASSKTLKTAIFISIILASLTINYYYFNILNLNPDSIYLSTEARSFGFFIGGTVALFEQNIRNKLGEYIGYTLAIVGSVGLVFSFFTFSAYADWFYPFGFLTADMLTVILLVSFLNSTYVRESFNTLSWLGKRSYSLYLIHYPVFIISAALYNIDVIMLIIVVSALIPLSDLIYRLVEEPFRKLDFKVKPIPVYVSSVLLILILGGFTVLSKPKEDAKPDNKDIFIIKLQASEKLLKNEEEKKEKTDKETFTEPDQNTSEKLDGTSVFMIGDSVLLGAAKYIKSVIPNAKIDAKVGRQAFEVLDVLNRAKEDIDKSEVVVFHIGNNGFVKKDTLERIVNMVGSDKKIYFLTVNAPVPWKEAVNQNIRYLQKYENVKVIDWDKHNEEYLFVKDRVHLSSRGIIRYANLIKSDIGMYISLKPKQEDTTTERLKIDLSDRRISSQEKKNQNPEITEEQIDKSAQEILDYINQTN